MRHTIIRQKDVHQEEIKCIFTYNQKVQIITGFYRGKIGIIKEVFLKDNMIYYKVEIYINDRDQKIELSEDNLLEYKLQFKNPLKKLFGK